MERCGKACDKKAYSNLKYVGYKTIHIVTKDYGIIKPKQNSTIAQLSEIQHKIIRFFSICIYSKSRKYEPAGYGVF